MNKIQEEFEKWWNKEYNPDEQKTRNEIMKPNLLRGFEAGYKSRDKERIMNIDYIKWLGGYAKGFGIRFTGTINHELIEYRHKSQIISCDWHNLEKWFLYPFLIQKAIEGINKTEVFEIIQTRSNIVVYNYEGSPPLNFELEPDNETEAKEEALKYIWEQEKSNE